MTPFNSIALGTAIARENFQPTEHGMTLNGNIGLSELHPGREPLAGHHPSSCGSSTLHPTEVFKVSEVRTITQRGPYEQSTEQQKDQMELIGRRWWWRELSRLSEHDRHELTPMNLRRVIVHGYRQSGPGWEGFLYN